MNRQLRFEAAYEAVAQALLTGRTLRESELRAIAVEHLGASAAFLATRAIDRCILTSTGTIGPDIFVDDDCGIATDPLITYTKA